VIFINFSEISFPAEFDDNLKSMASKLDDMILRIMQSFSKG